jgi:hypothetical protein
MRSRILISLLLPLLALPSAFATQELIQNGGFEATTPAPWGLNGSGVMVGNTSGFAAVGSQYLAMGNFLVGTGEAYQIITFPTNMIAATLSFDYDVATTNANGQDGLLVYIGNTTYPIPEELIFPADITSANKTTSYVGLSRNIIPYAGQGALSTYAGQPWNFFSRTTALIPPPPFSSTKSASPPPPPPTSLPTTTSPTPS